ncbi:hypothetical protein PF005_g22994 [Phytophthora fragariae]|uniref:Uncharacterized protein n=1 Tax=Phytophthora fragariae TaxID=53985 RepID=A0A6A3WC76_9STRA|nr:hypothetical protein PF010_g11954 [Phytophthora fragariae]KAE9181137.1 hypothetical protein PF005_g22994 [Phytophthora fragariae]
MVLSKKPWWNSGVGSMCFWIVASSFGSWGVSSAWSMSKWMSDCLKMSANSFGERGCLPPRGASRVW